MVLIETLGSSSRGRPWAFLLGEDLELFFSAKTLSFSSSSRRTPWTLLSAKTLSSSSRGRPSALLLDEDLKFFYFWRTPSALILDEDLELFFSMKTLSSSSQRRPWALPLSEDLELFSLAKTLSSSPQRRPWALLFGEDLELFFSAKTLCSSRRRPWALPCDQVWEDSFISRDSHSPKLLNRHYNIWGLKFRSFSANIGYNFTHKPMFHYFSHSGNWDHELFFTAKNLSSSSSRRRPWALLLGEDLEIFFSAKSLSSSSQWRPWALLLREDLKVYSAKTLSSSRSHKPMIHYFSHSFNYHR